ncbi:macro domain-containing protein [Nonomuraea recticatena]|uniref:Macro domain-containing protein n=1 Tax=Nonomuraea recticatena TaxID=46178 RepID=A0ABP6DY55_9ACTN
MLSYVTGDATAPLGGGPRIICHICNDIGGWGRGFVVALSRRWSGPEAAYRAWHREGFDLGEVQVVQVETGLWVANMIAQHGIRPTSAGPPIRYDALDRCLAALAVQAAELGASVHMPRIGSGLAGGTWDRIEPLIIDNLVRHGMSVTVYDLEHV